MKRLAKILIVGGLCSCAGSFTALASTNLETSSSLAGISVALNNYYASNKEPEKALSEALGNLDSTPKSGGSNSGSSNSGDPNSGGQAAPTAAPESAAAAPAKPKSSPYDNVAVSKVNGYVNIRTAASTGGDVAGKIYNDSAATILDTVDGEGGKWYKIQSGSVTGYIKAEYFVTGAEAENRAKQVGTQYGTVSGTPTLRLRENPDLTSKTLTLLSEGAHYVITGEQGDFLKVAVDSDLEGYVFRDYMKTNVEFQKAVSAEEEKAKEAEEAKRKKEAEDAIKKLEEAKAAEKKTTAAETTKKQTEAETTKAKETTAASGTIAANPDSGSETTVAAPTTAKETTKAKPKETTISPGPGSGGGNSGEVNSATRNAIVAYARQFVGNAYVYGGTSLTNGADCSGFTMSVFSHFGISTGRSSRDQAAKGRTISTSDVKPGDLLFYASGDYINHVAIYIGGGQVVHASNETTGICISPANYRTPCKAVTFLD